MRGLPRTAACVSSILIVVGVVTVQRPGMAQCVETLIEPSIGVLNDEFADRRAMAVDGSTLVVGSLASTGQNNGAGLAFVYEYTGGAWVETDVLRSGQFASSQAFGRTCAIDGDTIMVRSVRQFAPYSPPGGGAVFVFEREAGAWAQTQRLFDPTIGSEGVADGFGASIALVGDTAYISNWLREKVRIYERIAGVWTETGEISDANVSAFPLPSGTSFGGGSVSVEGNRMIVSHLAGTTIPPVSVLEFDGTTWQGIASLTPQSPGQYEDAPWVQIENGTVFVGSSLEAGASGVVRVYEEVAGSWLETQVIAPSNLSAVMRFGLAFDVHGDTLIVGAPGDDIGPQNDNNGAVYQFSRQGSSWVEERRWVTSHPPSFDSGGMGTSVALGAHDILAGSPAFRSVGRVHVFPLEEPQGVAFGDARPSSTGLAAVLSAHGSVVASRDCLTLGVDQLPLGRTGYFLMSRTQGYFPLFGGSEGDLLLGSPWYRFSQEVLDTGTTGRVSFPLRFGDLPQGVLFQPGETWSFQLWFRDMNPAPTSNTSNGLALTLVTPGDPAVQFPVTLARLDEEAAQVPILITLSQQVEHDVLVPYTVSGSATLGVDWMIDVPSPVVVPAGAISTTIHLSVLEDSEQEGDESATLTLGAPLGAVAGTTVSFELTIVDDD
ncbi:MAG: hypothetical protein GY725_10855 [bacterium]|nr:hypothetical protein [bacterium]